MRVIYHTLLAMLLAFAVGAQANDGFAVSGAVYPLNTGTLAYRELFTRVDVNGLVQVNYIKPDGVIFARKTLNYATESFQPGFELNDERDEETLSANFEGGRLLLTHKKKGDSQTKTLYDTARLVIDAGADAFIQLHWVELNAGKTIEFKVANARKLDVEKFVIKQIAASESPLAYKGAATNWVYFRVDTSKKLAAIFAESIFYAYDPEGKYLMRYQGRANIDSDTGEAWNVRIEYEYF